MIQDTCSASFTMCHKNKPSAKAECHKYRLAWASSGKANHQPCSPLGSAATVAG